MAVTKVVLRKNPAPPGRGSIDFSVTFDSNYKPTTGMAISFDTVTLFPNKVIGISELKGPVGYMLRVTTRTNLTPTNVKLHLVLGATTAGIFVETTTNADVSTITSHLRVYGW